MRCVSFTPTVSLRTTPRASCSVALVILILAVLVIESNAMRHRACASGVVDLAPEAQLLALGALHAPRQQCQVKLSILIIKTSLRGP